MNKTIIQTDYLKKTKMICTIGPATSDRDSLEKLIHIGMNGARLNFSHGKHEEFVKIIRDIRQLSKKHHKPIAIIQDLQGPKIRVGEIENQLYIKTNDIAYIGKNLKQDFDPTYHCIPIQYDFIPYLHANHTIFFNDGYLKAKVEEVKNDYAIIKFLNDGTISSNKGINIPDTLIDEPCLTEKDLYDLSFGLKNDVDYIAISFVQKAEDVLYTRDLINKVNPRIKIITKVETKHAIENIESIIDVTDMIMVARGDLAVEIGMENIPVWQSKIIQLCKDKKKPVIVATQMLESMITNPRPTRAEVSDVANAAISEVDDVMLSAESAVGKYPFDATEMMRSIVKTTENNNKLIYDKRYENIHHEQSNADAIASAATLLANNMNCNLLVVATESGKSAIALASLRPNKTIIAVTQSEKVYNQLAMIWGIKSFLVDKTNTIDDLIDNSINILRNINYVEKGAKLIFMTGLKVGIEGETNSLRIIDI